MTLKLAFKNPVFAPAMKVVIAITNANPLVVTTSIDGINASPHWYKNGLIVRIDIPRGFGMQQLNQQNAPITVINTTTFSMPIDSTGYDSFSVPTAVYLAEQYVQCVPIAELTLQLNEAVRNILPY